MPSFLGKGRNTRSSDALPPDREVKWASSSRWLKERESRTGTGMGAQRKSPLPPSSNPFSGPDDSAAATPPNNEKRWPESAGVVEVCAAAGAARPTVVAKMPATSAVVPERARMV